MRQTLLLLLVVLSFDVCCGETPRWAKAQIVQQSVRLGWSVAEIVAYWAGVQHVISSNCVRNILSSFGLHGRVVMQGDFPRNCVDGMTSQQEDELLDLFDRSPELFVDEAQDRIATLTGVRFSWSTIERALLKHGYNSKQASARKLEFLRPSLSSHSFSVSRSSPRWRLNEMQLSGGDT